MVNTRIKKNTLIENNLLFAIITVILAVSGVVILARSSPIFFIRIFGGFLVQIALITFVWRYSFGKWLTVKKRLGLFPTVVEEIMPLRILFGVFAGFVVAFLAAAILMFKKALPSECTYELVFGPVIIVGLFWFISLSRQAYQDDGRNALLRYLLAFVFMLLLANAVDLTLIKLGAWNFSKHTNLCNLRFPGPLSNTVNGEPMTVPLVEVFGFNGTITWFLFFCGVFINRLVNIPPSAKKNPRATSPTQQN